MFGQPTTGIDVVAPVGLQLFSHFFGEGEERFQAPIFLYSCIISPVHHLHRGMLCCWYSYYRIVEGDLAAEDLLELPQHSSRRDVRGDLELVFVVYE